MRNHRISSGFTLIEVLIGMSILAIVSTSIYMAFASVVDIIQSGTYNSAALSAIESQIEAVRNMRYEDVGVIGGVPSGTLPQTQTVMVGTTPMAMHLYVRNIDDPFDGILGASPSDTAPADYKLVEIQVTCDSCTRYNVISMISYVAPKNLESTTKKGNLFIRVFDASGLPVQGATVHVTNTKTSPAIDLTDITNSDGLLQLVDTATGSAAYHLVVSKNGYSGDQTYPPGTPPNPLKPDATVAKQQLTISSLAIDRVSALNITARDRFCAPVSGFDFLATGGKLIGTSPDTPKYSVAQATGVNGDISLNALEWDTYALKPVDTMFDIAGAPASLSVTINPNTTQNMSWMVASRSGSAMSVAVRDSTGLPINDAVVHVTKAGYDQSSTTGSWTLAQTDWPAGSYDSKSAALDTSTAGQLSLLQSGGVYASASQWLISNTYNLGTTSTVFGTLNWNPVSQPPTTGFDSLTFQVAANNDNATWNWVGPDGTPGTFFTLPGQSLPSSLNGKQYLRYRVYLKTAVGIATPTLQDVSIVFSSGCVTAGQAYVNGMSNGVYTLTVTRPGYTQFVGTTTISDTWQRMVITLSP